MPASEAEMTGVNADSDAGLKTDSRRWLGPARPGAWIPVRNLKVGGPRCRSGSETGILRCRSQAETAAAAGRDHDGCGAGLNLTLKTEMAGDHDAGLKTEMA